jgi:hypothetical protein
MELRERVLYHQIHPIKLLTDVGTATLAAVLFWHHALGAALVVGFVPSIAVSYSLIRWANLEPYRNSAFGRYVRRFMTRRVEAARFAGLIPLWGGAWTHRAAVVGVGALWIVGCWLWGVRNITFDKRST